MPSLAKNSKKVSREINGVCVEQRNTDGFINATAMCVAHDKKIDSWFRTSETLQIFVALSLDLDPEFNCSDLSNLDVARLSASKYVKMFPSLIISKRGSSDLGGGTWLHPDLAIQLAQWCSPVFAIQVSKWVRQWMVTGKNPIISEDDRDRASYRTTLKDDSRLRMTDQVKEYLQKLKKYDDQKYRGIYFARVHDAINIAITGETSSQMRGRLAKILGREVKESELIRDYFPAMPLQQYIVMCEGVANFMIQESMKPLDAVKRASKIVLPANHVARPIDFVEYIGLVRGRIAGALTGS